MQESFTDLSEHLQKVEILSSAPCRLDVGGTWDLKCFALPYASLNPATTNVAISARTGIRLRAYRPGYVRILDEFHHEAFPANALDLTGHFGLLFAIAAHFALAGVEIEIAYGCPPRSGVGGSGTLSVALAGALSRARELVGGSSLSPEEIIEIVYNIEDGLRFFLYRPAGSVRRRVRRREHLAVDLRRSAGEVPQGGGSPARPVRRPW